MIFEKEPAESDANSYINLETGTVDHAQVYPQRYKVLKTGALILCQTFLGLYIELCGPALPELMAKTGLNYEEIGRAMMTSSISFLASSTASGYLSGLLHSYVEAILGAAFLIGGTGTILMPWATAFTHLVVLYLAQGVGIGTADVCNNLLVLRIWAFQSAIPINCLHLGYATGALFGPQFIKQFLVLNHDKFELTTNCSNQPELIAGIKSNCNTTVISETEAILKDLRLSQVLVPYTIAGVIIIGLAFALICTNCYEQKVYGVKLLSASKTNTNSSTSVYTTVITDELKVFAHSPCKGNCKRCGFCVLVFLFIYFATIVGSERAGARYLRSFAQESSVSFSDQKALNLNSLYWIAFLSGRILSIFAPLAVSGQLYIALSLALSVASSSILTVCGGTHPLALWVGSALFGFALSPLYPACIGWVNRFINVRGLVLVVMTIGAATGAILFEWLAGYMFNYRGPQILMYMLLVASLISCLSYMCTYLIVIRHGERNA